MITARTVALTLPLLSLTACGPEASYTFDPIAPTGSYEVGVTEVTRSVPNRAESLGPEVGERRFTAALWYPAEPAGTEALRPWLGRFDLEELEPLSKQDFAYAKAAASVDTWAFEDAPVAAGNGEPWPVLLFSPGLGGLPELYSITAQELASQGYVVVTLNHPYDSAVTDFGDGTYAYGEHSTLKLIFQGLLGSMSLPGMEPGPEKDEKTRDVLSGNEYLQDLTRIRAADFSDAIDLIEDANRGDVGPLQHLASRLDIDRIGAFGHSIGGAAAVQAALDDPRIGAASNWDGSQWGDVYGQDPGVPVLFLETGSMPGFNDMIYTEVEELQHVYRDGWRHGALCDLPFMVGMDPEDYAKQFGSGDPEVYLPELNAMMGDFFENL